MRKTIASILLLCALSVSTSAGDIPGVPCTENCKTSTSQSLTVVQIVALVVSGLLPK